MRPRRWMCGFGAALIVLTSVVVVAKEHGRDKDNDEQKRAYRYSGHDRKVMKNWRQDHLDNLPPGLAKSDQLPSGLERQLRVRGTLPPGLRDRIRPCPEELARRLPPPPRDCENVVIGGHIVLLNRSTFVILDIFHFER